MQKQKVLLIASFFIVIFTLLSPLPSYASTQFTAAALQFNPILRERDKNIQALADAIEKTAQEGATLIVGPEMSTTGYQYKDRNDIAPYTDTIPGVATDAISSVTKKYNIYVVFGIAERDTETGLFYNAAALVGPNGYIGKYRKSHQWETEEHWSVWGDVGVPVFETPIGKIAINICMDSAYFEPARLAGLAGADILAFPTNSTAQALWALQSRAVQNGMYVVAANRSDTELDYHMIGASAIWSPTGELLKSAEILPTKEQDIKKPNAIFAQIDPSKYKNMNKDRMAERKPELYKDIALHISPWNYRSSTEQKDIKALTLQYSPVKNDKKANRKKIDDLISANNEKVNLIVLPELSLTDLPDTKNAALKIAEVLSGETVSYYKSIASAKKAYVVGGLVEKNAGKLYNTAVLISPDGSIAGEYRKIHLNIDEKKWAAPGDKLGIFDADKWRVGIMMGYESNFPEMAGLMAVKRVDAIAVPARWNGDYGCTIDKAYKLAANQYPENSMTLFDSVALISQAYPIIANFTGTDKNYQGGSGIYALDPLYALDKVELLNKEEKAFLVKFTTLQKDWWFNQEKLIGGRNPHMYKPIVTSK